ncbi:MAG: hypothetical protein PHQ19_07485 [Candidatus Krumholzibacteria bacterium]|nr:hypothetical protein [Candidatus Krumholzibacteria bacterium]
MKRIVLIAAIVMMAASAAHSQSQGYVCLFVDDARTSYCAAPPGAYPLLVNMQIWCLPRADGTYCAEFMIDYPDDPTVIAATVTPDPTFTIVLGSLATGVSACYGECKTEWTKFFTQLIVCQNANQNMISVVNHPGTGEILMTECTGIRPTYPAVAWNNLYLNYTDGIDPECGFTATEDKTWGAIKRMYGE